MFELLGMARFPEVNDKGETVKVALPAPPDGTGAPWLADYIRENAADIGRHFGAFQWPPTSQAQGIDSKGSDGYGVEARWIIKRTRYGTSEKIAAAIAALNAVGVSSSLDAVLHQLLGPEQLGPGRSRYPDSEGGMNGRGATEPDWFRGQMSWNKDKGTWNDPIPPFSPQDAVPSPKDDQAFGRELSPGHSPGAWKDGIDWIKWIVERYGFSDFRLDDSKGTMASFIQALVKAAGVPAVIEHFEGNPNILAPFVASLGNGIAALDFPAHWRIREACMNHDATALLRGGGGLWQMYPELADVFVDNADTDLGINTAVVGSKLLGYAWAATVPARRCLVFPKDYFPKSVWPGAYGMKKRIDNLALIHQAFAFGKFAVRWQDQKCIAVTRDGDGGALGWSGGMLTAISFDTWNKRWIHPRVTQAPGTWLHDYTGLALTPDVRVKADQTVDIQLNSNAWDNGQSYAIFAPGGVELYQPKKPIVTAQTFVADGTLDVKKARNGMIEMADKLWCAQDSKLDVTIEVERRGVSTSATVQVEVIGPDDKIVAWATTGAMATAHATGTVKVDGPQRVRYIGNLLPLDGANFRMTVRYIGTSK